jgi:hypothetical protein
MFRRPSHHRSLLVALVAMAGMALGASVATAASKGSGDSCCASPMPAGCQCCPSANESAAVPSPALPARSNTVPCVSGPGSGESCVCRPAQPAQRDTRQESRTTEDRASEPLDELPLPAASYSPRPSFASPASFAHHPPRAALYLRIERLLI